MLPFLKWFRRKKPKPEQKRRAQVVTGQERLIPLINFSRSRRPRAQLLQLDGLDPRSCSVITAMQYLTNEEIHGPRPRPRWSDPH